MAKKQSEYELGKCSRLLNIFTPNKIFTIFIFLFLSNFALHAVKLIKVGIEYSSKTLTTDDIFVLKFNIYNYTGGKKFKSHFAFNLNDEEKFLNLEESLVYPHGRNLIVENKYSINKAGKLKLDNITVSFKKYIIKQESVELNITAPGLSEKTKFRRRIFDIEKKAFIAYSEDGKDDENYKITQGKKYLFLLEGFFYKESSSLPKIANAECNLPNNAFFEKTDITDFNIEQEFGWNILNSYFWIPIYNGLQQLPDYNITIFLSETEEKKIISEKKFVSIFQMPAKKNTEINHIAFHDNFSNIKNKKSGNYTSKLRNLEFAEKTAAAKKLSLLRKKESVMPFAKKISAERKEVELSLGLKNSFSPSVSFYYILFFALFILLIFIIPLFIVLKRKNKKRIPVTYFFIFFVFILSFFAYCYYFYDLRKEYICIPDSQNFDFKIYQSPEKNSSILSDLKIGEAVKIIYKNNNWIYIEKYNGVKGWFDSRNYD